MSLWEKQLKNFEDSETIDVYEENFLFEINQIKNHIEEGFNYIGLDTEFPGIIFFPKFEEKYKFFFAESIKNNSEIIKNYNYDTMRLNINNLKPIQIGLCLFNISSKQKKTYQFNLKFNILKEKFCKQSIELLQKSGINFPKISEEGIEFNFFSEILKKNGIIFNKKITWITFHGLYDLGYLLKIFSNKNLPEEKNFLETLEEYFPNFYDLKFLLRNSCFNNSGLKKLGKVCNIYLKGNSHQAGFDSLMTIEVFSNLIQRGFLKENFLKENKNNLWGIGAEFDSIKLLEYLLKNQIFYNYYYTNYYYQMNNANGYMIYNYGNFNANYQVNYITEKRPRNNMNYYGL